MAEKYKAAEISINDAITDRNFKPYYDELIKESSPTEIRLFELPFQKNKKFTGREEQLNQISEFLNEQNTLAITNTINIQTQAIAGLGGVGKTQLAIEYAYREKNKYKVVWFLSGQNMDSDYLRLAAQLKIYGKNKDDIILRTKLKLLELGNYLLIIDDAENYETIKGYLPQTGSTGHVLITTRHRLDWGKILELGVFSLEEGLNYFKKLIDFKEEDKEDVKYLIEKLLGLLPLALTQSGAFIRQTGISIKEYNQYFEKNYKNFGA